VVDEEPAEVTPLPEAKPEPETLPAVLPDTAGPLPLVGSLGVIFLVMGAAVGLLRRRIR
jgi:hypothetical protein